MSRTLTYSDTLSILECGECHISFAMPENLHRSVKRTGDWFWCPNGHEIHYYEPENTRLKAELDQARADARWQEQQKDLARVEQRRLERSNSALKGHLTRWRKRIGQGVCPVAGCKRHFPNVQSHVATVHPDWLAAHPEVFEDADG